MPRADSRLRIAAPPRAGLPGSPEAAPMVRNSCCVITLLLNLLMSRMSMASGGDSCAAISRASARHRALAHLAGPHAALPLPQRAEHRGEVAGVLERAEIDGALAAGEWIDAAQPDVHRVADVGLQPPAPVAAAAFDGRHGARRLEAGDFGHDDHARHLADAVGHERDGDGFEIHQQRIGPDVVGTAFLAVELGRDRARWARRRSCRAPGRRGSRGCRSRAAD